MINHEFTTPQSVRKRSSEGASTNPRIHTQNPYRASRSRTFTPLTSEAPTSLSGEAEKNPFKQSHVHQPRSTDLEAYFVEPSSPPGLPQTLIETTSSRESTDVKMLRGVSDETTAQHFTTLETFFLFMFFEHKNSCCCLLSDDATC